MRETFCSAHLWRRPYSGTWSMKIFVAMEVLLDFEFAEGVAVVRGADIVAKMLRF
jgi:hypothetical protein